MGDALTKDQRIRYRCTELEALQSGHIFCLANGKLPISQRACVRHSNTSH